MLGLLWPLLGFEEEGEEAMKEIGKVSEGVKMKRKWGAILAHCITFHTQLW